MLFIFLKLNKQNKLKENIQLIQKNDQLLDIKSKLEEEVAAL